MTYRFEKVLDGLSKYIDGEIYHEMNDLQEVAARICVGRIINNTEYIKKSLMDNGFIRTFGVIDEEGMVDIDSLAKDIKREMERKGKLVVSLPMFGKFTFTPNDIDVIVTYIKEGL